MVDRGNAAGTDGCIDAYIDCHTHVWTTGLPLSPERHYTPRTDHPLGALLAELDLAAITRAVLVQPSFLADDNAYLVDALSRHPHRLRGVATFKQAPQGAEVHRLHAAGVRALRLNLFGPTALPDSRAAWRPALQAMRDLGWHIVVAGSGEALADVLRSLASLELPLLIDHCAMPSTADAACCPGVRALVEISVRIECWIKLSAPYRLPGQAADAAAIVTSLNGLGFADRYVWGSDSPFTRFEDEQSYPQAVGALNTLIAQGLVNAADLRRNASRLYFG